VRDGRVLLGHRSADRKWFPDVWDLVGGHIEVGETPTAALVRELREELGIDVTEPPADEWARVTTTDFDLGVWLITQWSGDIVNAAPDEHDLLSWFALAEVAELELADPSYLGLLTGALAGAPGGPSPVRYQSPDEDSARWLGFPFRDGDIVISTRSKSGTTWMQMICALLVFQTPEFPVPLSQLSPWLDWTITPRREVVARLEAQEHRRIIKTHTPLDGVVLDRRATYIVVARDPLDMAVSLYHQSANINRDRSPADSRPPLPPLHEWLLSWIGWEGSPLEQMDSLPGVMWHLSDVWARRDQPNIVLVHYDDLLADLEGEMRGMAERLGIVVAEAQWSELVHAAEFAQMRTQANQAVAAPSGVLKDPSRFFRRGTSGEGREVLTAEEVARYRARVDGMASPGLSAWLHRWAE
jgi:8-oxo-dGTP pyrophosphatase MutT (NUDIX family)